MSAQKELEVPAYAIRINTSAFAYKKSQLRERTQAQWLGHFWSKCGMDQKRISPSCQDRLSELTTGQIDRIIDMERIRTLLHDKKRKAKEIFIDYQPRPNAHPHVYEANFLAKINAIAIRRNIRHEKSQGFDEYIGQHSPHQKEKKTSQVPYKYLKKYRLDSKIPRRSMQADPEQDEKSIGQIEDKLDDFEERLERCRATRNKKTKEDPRCSAMRWFNGMSNYYLHKDKPEAATISNFERMANFDIESELRHAGYSHFSTGKCRTEPTESMGRSEPFVKFKISRVNRVVSVK